MSIRREVVLVADDDEDIVRFVEVNLRLEGFEVITANDGKEALAQARDVSPDLVLLDIMMPEMDGFEVCQRLRASTRTKHVPIIMLTAKSLSADKVVGLTSGADDYIIKPFDPIELVARVKSALRRVREMRSVNPLTQLPGNVQVQDEVAKRVADGAPFALMYVDLDNFKAFNDHYGFLRGDEAIKTLAATVDDAVRANGGGFVGHVGGDDFVVLVDPAVSEAVAQAIISAWADKGSLLYDEQDLERGYIEVADRRSQLHRYGVTTVSIGIASNERKPISSHWEASEIATEMKQFAKREQGSSYAMDRREQATSQAPPPPPPPPPPPASIRG
ncbi:MAG: response regulator [Actinomycetota bacterium]|nr:response regulator [Actinomycetota bacterium]